MEVFACYLPVIVDPHTALHGVRTVRYEEGEADVEVEDHVHTPIQDKVYPSRIEVKEPDLLP